MIKYYIYDFLGYNSIIFRSLNNKLQDEHIQIFLSYISFLFNISNFAIYYIIAFVFFLVCCPYSRNCCALYFKIRPIIHLPFQRKFNSWIMGSVPSLKQAAKIRERFSHFVEIGIIYSMIGLLYSAMKFGFNMPRPFCNETLGEFKTIIDTSLERCLSSFPSSHVAISILCAYSVWKFTGNISKCFCVIIIILTSISRIALAMHYPADILYSVIICFIIIRLGKNFAKLVDKLY
ncbi:MAG: phosphatase PAP2 family protein [Rickettsiaceae bacterium]|nr:phosphatase PAP2 family protein [Rickettsiaceae bacterium]